MQMHLMLNTVVEVIVWSCRSCETGQKQFSVSVWADHKGVQISETLVKTVFAFEIGQKHFRDFGLLQQGNTEALRLVGNITYTRETVMQRDKDTVWENTVVGG